MRTTGILFLAALAGAALVAATASREPFAARMIRLEAARAAPDVESVLDNESLAVNAVFAQYAERPVLRLNAQLALLEHPDMAREVLPLYGSEPEFQDVLARFGPAVLLPISYFLHHDVASLEVLRATGEAVRGATRAAARLLGVAGKDDEVRSAAATTSGTGALTPEERGWYAVGFIREEGHDFLGQFVLDASAGVQWVQTERITEAAAALFSGGIRGLETKLRQDEVPTTTDYLWAGVDLALAAGAVKVLRAGRASGAAAGAGSASTARASLASRTVLRAGRTALRVGRYGVPVAVAYAVVRHPSLISGLAAQAAAVLGWPVPVVQAAVWFVVLLPLLLALRLVLRWLVRPALAVLRATTRGLLRLEKHRRAARHAAGGEPPVRVVPRIGDLSPSVEPGIGDQEPVRLFAPRTRENDDSTAP